MSNINDISSNFEPLQFINSEMFGKETILAIAEQSYQNFKKDEIKQIVNKFYQCFGHEYMEFSVEKIKQCIDQCIDSVADGMYAPDLLEQYRTMFKEDVFNIIFRNK